MTTTEVREIPLDEIDISSVLGSGTFSMAYQVRFRSADPTSKEVSWTSTTTVKKSASFADADVASLAETAVSTDSEGSEFFQEEEQQNFFCMKMLHQKALSTYSNREAASRDLLHEAAILSKVSRHPNIVTLQGVSPGFWENPTDGFLVLEFLYETLSDRLAKWRRQTAVSSVSSNSLLSSLGASSHHNQQKQQQIDRLLQVGLPIARAMSFLHDRCGICYRDLKPQNIGFNAQGSVRLYDFGFARKVSEDDSTSRRLTDLAGTPRYMAPEVMMQDDSICGKSADVYSFSILLWETLTLERPYAKAMTNEMGDKESQDAALDSFYKRVAREQVRPALNQVKSKSLQKIIASGWSAYPLYRPSFACIVQQLDDYVTNFYTFTTRVFTSTSPLLWAASPIGA